MGAAQSEPMQNAHNNDFMANIDLACVSLSAMDSWPSFSPQAEQDIQAIKTLHSKSSLSSINTPSPHSRKRSRPSRQRNDVHLTAPNFTDSFMGSFNNKCKTSPPRPPEMHIDHKSSYNLSSNTNILSLRQRGAPIKTNNRSFSYQPVVSNVSPEDDIISSSSLSTSSSPPRRSDRQSSPEPVLSGNVPIALSTFAHNHLAANKQTSRTRVRSLLRATEIKSASPKRPAVPSASPIHHLSPLRLRKPVDTITTRSQSTSQSINFHSVHPIKSSLIQSSVEELCDGSCRVTLSRPSISPCHDHCLSSPTLLSSTSVTSVAYHVDLVDRTSNHNPQITSHLDVTVHPSSSDIPLAPEMSPSTEPIVSDFAPAPPPFESIPCALPCAPPLDNTPPCAPPCAPSIDGAPAPPVMQITSAQIKLKKIHWQTLSACDATDSIFGQSSDSAPRLDLADITKKFAVTTISKSTSRPASIRSINPSNVRVIDQKRATNINIAMKRFRMTSAALSESIIKLDHVIVSSEEHLQSIISMIPRSDEIKALNSLVNDRNCQPNASKVAELSDVEQLMLSLSSIPHLEERLHSLSFMLTFDRSVAQLIDHLTTVEEACLQVRSSESLRLVMHVILTVGNALNNTSAQGFRLGLLSSLTAVKTNDQSNLFDYVVNIVRTQCPTKTRRLVDELQQVRLASKIESGVLSAETQSIQQHVTKCSQLLASIAALPTKSEADSAFVRHVADFEERALPAASELNNRLNRVLSVTSALTKYFGEPEWLCERFFDQLHQFVTQFQAINEALDEKERRQERVVQQKSSKVTSGSRTRLNDENLINRSIC